MKMTPEQEELAQKLFAVSGDDREGKDRLTVRFDPHTHRLFYGPKPGQRDYRIRHREAVLLHYVEQPARTPTGGKYLRKALTVRTKDGRKWYGTMKKDSDVVRLRLAPPDTPNPNPTD